MPLPIANGQWQLHGASGAELPVLVRATPGGGPFPTGKLLHACPCLRRRRRSPATPPPLHTQPSSPLGPLTLLSWYRSVMASLTTWLVLLPYRNRQRLASSTYAGAGGGGAQWWWRWWRWWWWWLGGGWASSLPFQAGWRLAW